MQFPLLPFCPQISLLITDLLTSEVWRSKIFSIIKKLDFEPKTTIPLYMALYHEATVTNLLETIMFYKVRTVVLHISIFSSASEPLK